jgi:hypothetical protein
MADAEMAAPVVSWVRSRPSTRAAMNGSTMATRRWAARSVTARLHASSVPAVAGSSRSMRVSILPPWNPMAASVAAS